MRQIPLWIFLILNILFINSNIAQQTQLKPKQKISVTEGLSRNGVTAMLEDSKGFLWVATYDGLNKYNGYEAEIFKNTLNQEILVHNRIRTIFEDPKGNLLIGTEGGISLYHYEQNKFESIYDNASTGNGANGPIVRKILFNAVKEHFICLTEDNGILIFDENYTFVRQHVPPTNYANKSVAFYDGVALDPTSYLFSTSIGVSSFNLETGEFVRVLPAQIRRSDAIISSQKDVFIATGDSGAIIFKSSKIGENYLFEAEKTIFNDKRFTSLYLDKLNNLWFGHRNRGILHIQNFQNILNDKSTKTAYYLPDDEILRMSCFAPSKNNHLWVGTFNQGILRFGLTENSFKTDEVFTEEEAGFKQSSLVRIFPYDEERFFITTDQNPLALYNVTKQKREPLPFVVPPNQGIYATTILKDSTGDFWLNKNLTNELYHVKKGGAEWLPVKFKQKTVLNNSSFRGIAEDKDGNIWITYVKGTFKITLSPEREIEKVERLQDHPFFQGKKLPKIRCLYPDPAYPFLWVGTVEDGLLRVNTEAGNNIKDYKIDQFTRDKNIKNSVPSDFITAVLRLPNDDLWVGTERGGVCKVLNSDTRPSFVPFSETDGLTDNVVQSIQYDDEQNLWIGTNKGLNKLNTESMQLSTFRKSDGLPFEFFWYDALNLADGKMAFSGRRGFTYFDTQKLSKGEDLPNLEFGKLKIFNEIIKPGDTLNNRILYTNRLTNGDELNLNYDENVFSLELQSLHFSNTENHYLKYQMSPINTDWVTVASDERTLYYSGLPPGSYTLRVSASNSLKEWTEPQELKILISPPFWQTRWAYFFYLLLAALAIYAVFYFTRRFETLRANAQLRQVEKDTIEKMNMEKLRFFSNISHEIKTPLTLISGPMQLLNGRFGNNSEIGKKLGLMERQVKKIEELINQVQDLQKLDANLLKVKIAHFSFDDFLQDLVQDFAFMAKEEKKELTILPAEERIFVAADRKKLEKVFNNLLSNAFKHTKVGDTVAVKYEVEDDTVTVTIIDSGAGIDAADLPHIFERFYQSDKDESISIKGSGIGLSFTKQLVEMHYGYIDAASELGKGATFTVRLPIVKEISKEEQNQIEAEVLSAEDKPAVKQLLLADINLKALKTNKEFAESTVFLVEDNDDMRKFIADILGNYFKVKTFIDGQECLHALEEEFPQIIVSDVQMPNVNGFELCRRVKTNVKTSHIPIILLTAYTNINDRIQGISDGADAYIRKPFDLQHLITRIEALLQNRRQLQERFRSNFPLVLKKELSNAKDRAFLEKLYDLMEQNLDNQELELDSFAKQVYLNRTHFYQKVKALTNQTPYELLRNYRIKKAAELLAQGELSVNEVIFRTGFKSRGHFTKLFKEKYHISPGKYAASIMKGNDI